MVVVVAGLAVVVVVVVVVVVGSCVVVVVVGAGACVVVVVVVGSSVVVVAGLAVVVVVEGPAIVTGRIVLALLACLFGRLVEVSNVWYANRKFDDWPGVMPSRDSGARHTKRECVAFWSALTSVVTCDAAALTP